MKVSVVNLGCKVNRVESDTIAAAYAARGDELVDVALADTVIVNTCTVTEEADKKTRKTIRRVLRQNDHASVLVTGCAATIEPEFYRELDNRITVVDKHDLLDQSFHGDSEMIEAVSDNPNVALLRVGDHFPTRVAVKVQDGCNHACTYCIVHVARGKAWSRSVSSILQEVLLLAQNGVKEIVLSGIDLGSYSYVLDDQEDVSLRGAHDLSSDVSASQNRIRLANLVQLLLDRLEEQCLSDVRLRISSIEPRSIHEDFIEVLKNAQGRVCRHLHLPLQSGSTKVLKEMNRPYTAQDYLDLVERLKAAVGDISLTTDVIVGFPGETEEDFQETMRVVKQVGFTKVHVFRYSKREGTPAAQRSDQIDPTIKEERAHKLLHLSDELRADYIHRNAQRRERIVVEQLGWGMSESYYKVKLSGKVEPGQVITASLHTIDSSGVVEL